MLILCTKSPYRKDVCAGKEYFPHKKRPPGIRRTLNYGRIYKPSSVLQTGTHTDTLRSSYHLSVAAYPPATDEQPLTAGIHGLAGCSRIPPECRHYSPWALTPHFHPYRSNQSNGHYCGGNSLLPLHKLIAYLCFPQCSALPCPDFPPNFLSDRTTRQPQRY